MKFHAAKRAGMPFSFSEKVGNRIKFEPMGI